MSAVPKIRLIQGIGIYDSDEPTHIINDVTGKRVPSPYYQRWCSMLQRAYSESYHKQRPSYIDVTVCKQWHYFSNFKKWMQSQEWEGLALDKDLILPGNKKYSPKRCVFVSRELNNLLTYNRSEVPGVNFSVGTGRYRAQIREQGRKIYLGEYDTPEDASKAYVTAKVKMLKEVRATQTDKRIRKGLKRHIKLLAK